jgi:hypothetical protein
MSPSPRSSARQKRRPSRKTKPGDLLINFIDVIVVDVINAVNLGDASVLLAETTDEPQTHAP